MTPSTGWALVGAQFGLVAALVILPPGDLWQRGIVTVVIGGVALSAGAAIAIVAGLRLGPSLTPLPIPKDDGVLVTEGFYRYVRHPIYTGVLCVAAGVVIVQASVAHLVGLVALWGVLSLKALGEERMLREKFDDYSGYQRRTGRFIPRLTRR
jgi:protein-S-isoprenylcysteine O-methyltransferase Ste14